MAELFQVSVSGGAELARIFAELPKAIGQSVLREAEEKALQPVLDEAKTNLVQAGRVRSGNLLDSMDITTRLKPSQNGIGLSAGVVITYAGATGKRGAHAHLVEFGHKLVNGGRVPPHPFLRPAWEANKDKVLEIMRTEIWNALAKAAARLRARAQAGTLTKSQTKFFAE